MQHIQKKLDLSNLYYRAKPRQTFGRCHFSYIMADTQETYFIAPQHPLAFIGEPIKFYLACFSKTKNLHFFKAIFGTKNKQTVG